MPLTAAQELRIFQNLQTETGLAAAPLRATIALLDEGATVPFIARYRKEQTGGLDEVQVRQLQDALAYGRELEERKTTILTSIGEQGKLTPELQARIEKCAQKTELEDLYLPYKPKRRTRATIARERGLAPLAERILAEQAAIGPLEAAAQPFVDPDKEVATVADALAGASDILAETFSEQAEVRALVRQLTWEQGVLTSRVAADKAGSVTKFEMYYDYREPLKDVPSHRLLAMRRGEKEEVLRLGVEAPEEEILQRLRQRLIRGDGPHRPYLEAAITDAYRRLLAPSIEVEVRMQAKKSADATAIGVFAANLHNLLMAPPAGRLRVLGIDPGLRTGSKLAVVDDTGRFLDHATVYPHAAGRAKMEEAGEILRALVRRHNIQMIAVGNGTAGREVEQFARQALKDGGLECPVVPVSEAGASVYSASDIAREEFPELDLTIRGAISIARRLQDPLAELVKIDPKSIGVGQYQHDVAQPALKKALDDVVESCVNAVGVDLNTASAPLLASVSGIGDSLARAIVGYRDRQGAFGRRKDLLAVPRFGAKAFEQAAGFLRIRGGEQPLDNTAVHPERYTLVERMAQDLGLPLAELAGRPEAVGRIDLPRYVGGDIGLPTLQDIVAELQKPGRDPRQAFVAPRFRDDVQTLDDLKEGMELQGTVTNVTAFGAFVDIGVHQDGLVHVSELADRFVRDPAEVVKAGQLVQVRVLTVDAQRKRIALSMRSPGAGRPTPGDKRPPQTPAKSAPRDTASALAAAGFRVKKGR